MAIIPQIAVVKPDKEVFSYTGTSLSDVDDAIDENADGSFTQITLQQGVYIGTTPVEIPTTVFVVIMPGAEFQDDIGTLFVDKTNPSQPSPNVANLNTLRSGGTGGVVFDITTDDTLEQNSISGSIELGVDLANDKNSVLLDSKTNGDFDTLTVNPQNVVVRAGSNLQGLPMSNNSMIVKSGTSDLDDVQFSSNSILARFGTTDIQNQSIPENTVLGRTSGGIFDAVELTGDTILANVSGNGMGVVQLNDQGLIDAMQIQASDIASDTFKDQGIGVLYDFQSDVNIEYDLNVGNNLTANLLKSEVGEDLDIRGGIDVIIQGATAQGTGIGDGKVTIEGQSGSGPVLEVGDDSGISYTKQVSVKDFDFFSIISEARTISQGGPADRFIFHDDGYIDLPIRDERPPNPPEGYIRFYAQVDDLGNPTYEDGRIIIITSDGTDADFDAA